MKNKAVSGIMLTLLLWSILTVPFHVMFGDVSEPPATQWSKTYGGTKNDYAMCVIQTSDGGYAIVGGTYSFGSGGIDFWLVKTDSSGNMQWNKAYGGTKNDEARSVVETSDGGYVFAGYTYSFGAGGSDFWLVKTDSAGNMQWNKTYGGVGEDYGTCVIQTVDGGYALTGETFSFGVRGDFWLVKTDSSGNMQWDKTYGGTLEEYAMSVVQTDDGGYALTGDTISFGAGGRDFWLVKTDASGNQEWAKTYGGTEFDGLYVGTRCVVQTVDGGYAIVGWTRSFGAGNRDFWLVKTYSNGNMEWNKTYGGTESDIAYSIVQTKDSGYAIAGNTDSFGAGLADSWLIKTDSLGNIEWSKTYGGTAHDDARCVIQTIDDGYALAGGTYSFGLTLPNVNYTRDFWLVKIAPASFSAHVYIDPDTLNLRGGGKWTTAYIQLPEEYNAEDIDATTVLLNETISPVLDPMYEFVTNSSEYLVDHNEDGILERMVKFDKAEVVALLTVGEATLTITGEVNGTPFEGSDSIRVLLPCPRWGCRGHKR